MLAGLTFSNSAIAKKDKKSNAKAKVALLSFSTKGSASHDRVTMVQNATAEAKERFPQYEIDGETTDRFPSGTRLTKAKPVYTYLPGWKCDISGVRNWWDLPEEAQNYVKRIEEATGVVIKWISVGPERHSIIRRGQT